jgi:sRNA-binding carbon storage regulator CsrA
MLVLTRKLAEPVRVRVGGQTLWLMVADCDRGKVRIAFDGPLAVEITRDELLPPGEQYAAVTRDRRLMGDA